MAGREKRDIANIQGVYTVTNHSNSRSLSGTESTTATVALVLTNVIADLIEQGILTGSVA